MIFQIHCTLVTKTTEFLILVSLKKNDDDDDDGDDDDDNNNGDDNLTSDHRPLLPLARGMSGSLSFGNFLYFCGDKNRLSLSGLTDSS